MQEDIPILFLRDGRYDVAAGTTGRTAARARRMGAFVGDEAKRTADMFLSKGAQKLANPKKSPFLRQSVATNLNPRGLTRLGSMSQLTGQQATGFYTPFQGVPRVINELANRNAFGIKDKFGIQAGDNAYSGGVLGRMMSMNRANNMESQIARLSNMTSRTARQEAKLAKLTAQRADVVRNITNVQNLANPSAPTVVGSVEDRLQRQFARSAAARNVSGVTSAGGRRAAVKNATATINAQADQVIAGRVAAINASPTQAIGSTMTTGKISNAITSYYAGVINPELMTKAQRVLTKRVTRQIAGSAAGGRAGFASFMDDFGKTGRYAGNAARQMMGGGKMIGMAGQYLRSGGSRAVAAKFAGMGALKTVGAALPGLNVLATASLIYDVTKGIGKIAVAGQNFAKDAVKSMQGSINKPIFGAGFVDNEVSASSRARGVMAIQNSRLNARSLLGSEAAMMAAHFG
jgi:hypothetical protein